MEKTSPRSPRGETVNKLSVEQLNTIVFSLQKRKFIIETSHGPKCTYACTKKADGTQKYPQVDLNQFHFPGITGKQLVHLIYWRWCNNGELLDLSMDISHIDADSTILALVQEAHEMNESRKYCHLFGWYKTKPGEQRPRCPHWENPCNGP